MKFAVSGLAILMLTTTQAALAERRGQAFDMDDIEYGPPETSVPVPVKRIATPKAASQERQTVAAPLNIKPVAEKPAETKADRNYSVDFEPVKATIKTGVCEEPIPSPDAGKTPVLVTVDQQTQTIQVKVGDKVILTDIVSTGGGYKNPKGKNGRGPKCAKTNKIDTVVSNIKPSDFKGTTCTEQEKIDKSKVFDTYFSDTFTDEQGRRVPMPKAIRFSDDGEFFHVVPEAYKGMLGKNVSGGCVRLKESTAILLQKQIEKYGAIRVKVNEPPVVSRDMPQYCDDEIVAQAKLDIQNNKISSLTQSTGTESVLGGVKSFEAQFAKNIDIFGLLGHNENGIFFQKKTPPPAAQQPSVPRPPANLGRRS